MIKIKRTAKNTEQKSLGIKNRHLQRMKKWKRENSEYKKKTGSKRDGERKEIATWKQRIEIED